MRDVIEFSSIVLGVYLALEALVKIADRIKSSK